MNIIVVNAIRCVKLLKASDFIPCYKQNSYLKIKLYGNTWDNDLNTISGIIKIIDNDGNEIASIERSWPGNYLAVEFNVFIIDGGVYIFPDRLYGKDRIFEQKNNNDYGTMLSKYYLENNKCLLPGKESSMESKKHLYTIASFSKSKFPAVFVGKKMSYTVDLSQCKTGIEYSLNYTDTNGFTLSQN